MVQAPIKWLCPPAEQKLIKEETKEEDMEIPRIERNLH